jgi:hypothetical protein
MNDPKIQGQIRLTEPPSVHPGTGKGKPGPAEQTRDDEAHDVEKMPTIGSPDHASDPIQAPSPVTPRRK